MKNSMKEKMKKETAYFVLCPLLFIFCFLFTICSNFTDETAIGSISIIVGGGSSVSRSTTGYPPSDNPDGLGDPSGPALADLAYKVFFNGTEMTGNKTTNAQGTHAIQFTLSVGTYNVRIESYEPGGPGISPSLYAIGKASNVVVQAEQTTTVSISMSEAITVTFVLNDGTPAIHTTMQAGQGDTIREPLRPASAVNDFLGWYKGADCTTPWDFLTEPVTSNISLYGDWDFGGFTVSDDDSWGFAVSKIIERGNNKSYVIDVTAPLTLPGTSAATFGSVTGLTVTIVGTGNGDSVVTLSGTNKLLYIGTNQTVIMQDIDLQGITKNVSLVYVDGGSLTMQGSASVYGNENVEDSGGGVRVSSGSLTMKDNASIHDNKASMGSGGGVYVMSGGTFTMQDNARVYGNSAASQGGGVALNNGVFRLENGTVYGNDASPPALCNTGSSGGDALYVDNGTAEDGYFSGNTWISGASLIGTPPAGVNTTITR